MEMAEREDLRIHLSTEVTNKLTKTGRINFFGTVEYKQSLRATRKMLKKRETDKLQ